MRKHCMRNLMKYWKEIVPANRIFQNNSLFLRQCHEWQTLNNPYDEENINCAITFEYFQYLYLLMFNYTKISYVI